MVSGSPRSEKKKQKYTGGDIINYTIRPKTVVQGLRSDGTEIAPTTQPAPKPAPPTKLALVATPDRGAQNESYVGTTIIRWILSPAPTLLGE